MKIDRPNGLVEGNQNLQSDRMLRSMGEQLKAPLLQAAGLAELLQSSADDPRRVLHYARTIEVSSRYALQLLDGFDLAATYAYGQLEMPLEPVAVGGLLQDLYYELDMLLSQHQVKLDVRVAGPLTPVMSHYDGLLHALYALTYSVIDGFDREPGKRNLQLVLGARKTRGGVTVGLFMPGLSVPKRSLSRAYGLLGVARRPLAGTHAASATGIFIADSLSRSLASTLRVGRFGKQSGIALTLQPSAQLQFGFAEI